MFELEIIQVDVCMHVRIGDTDPFSVAKVYRNFCC